MGRKLNGRPGKVKAHKAPHENNRLQGDDNLLITIKM
ncbi:hypothetical protein HCH_00959 [Hahella chejuensis KCTC 2396]|uniref:Uncharacterized protein n=1 Tax=Hahella chejuensis (strain KCTC 2396) TaxID=349521 RepID=Q2SNC7_HAHCH|nr:hypothetical protein HCH_00959 [Hahella chejuensis KCTC 2396]